MMRGLAEKKIGRRKGEAKRTPEPTPINPFEWDYPLGRLRHLRGRQGAAYATRVSSRSASGVGRGSETSAPKRSWKRSSSPMAKAKESFRPYL